MGLWRHFRVRYGTTPGWQETVNQPNQTRALKENGSEKCTRAESQLVSVSLWSIGQKQIEDTRKGSVKT